MDRTDYQILNILQRDSRATLKSIGDQVGLTAPAVSERTRRLEEQGIIRAYRIEVDRERLNYNMTGFIQVAPVPEKYNDFCAFCARHPAIIAHYHTIGVFNALLQFAVQGTQELEVDALHGRPSALWRGGDLGGAPQRGLAQSLHENCLQIYRPVTPAGGL